MAEVFDHDRGTNGTFTLNIDGDGGIFEVRNRPIEGLGDLELGVKLTVRVFYYVFVCVCVWVCVGG